MDPTSAQARAQRLKTLRIALGQTLAGMAEIIGATSPQTWKNYEAGDRQIRNDVAVRLLQRTGANTDWILFGREDSLPQVLLTKIKAAERGDLLPPKRGRKRTA